MLCDSFSGHFVAAALAHAFCNVMGVPDLSWLRDPALTSTQRRGTSSLGPSLLFALPSCAASVGCWRGVCLLGSAGHGSLKVLFLSPVLCLLLLFSAIGIAYVAGLLLFLLLLFPLTDPQLFAPLKL